MSETIVGAGLRLRRAEPADADFLAELATSDEIEPFLAAVSPRTPHELRSEIERSLAEPGERGRLVIEVDRGGVWAVAGGLAYEVANRRSRIATVHAVMVAPTFRGQGLAERATRLVCRYLVGTLGYHRVELEVYGFNEVAMRVFERVGFVREGLRRRAYWRHGGWQDGVLYGILEEEVAAFEADPPSPGGGEE